MAINSRNPVSGAYGRSRGLSTSKFRAHTGAIGLKGLKNVPCTEPLIGHIWGRPHFRSGLRNIFCTEPCIGHIGHMWGRPHFSSGFRNVPCTEPCIGHIGHICVRRHSGQGLEMLCAFNSVYATLGIGRISGQGLEMFPAPNPV